MKMLHSLEGSVARPGAALSQAQWRCFPAQALLPSLLPAPEWKGAWVTSQ